MHDVVTILLIVFYVYIILSTISVLLMENRNPVKSISWLLVLVLIPFLGLIIYLVLGQDYRKRNSDRDFWC